MNSGVLRFIVGICFLSRLLHAESVPLLQMDLVNDLVFNPPDMVTPGKINAETTNLNGRRGWMVSLVDSVVVTDMAWADYELNGVDGNALLSINHIDDFPAFDDPVVTAMISAENSELTADGWRRVAIDPVNLEPGTYFIGGESEDERLLLIFGGAGPDLPVVRDPRMVDWPASCGDNHFGDFTCLLAPSVDIGPMIFVEPQLGTAGDFNDDDNIDLADIVLLSSSIHGFNQPKFDVNIDNVVDEQDLEIWVKELKVTYFGDANLDGEFNSEDLVQVFEANEYEDRIEKNSIWSEGDWNADADFDSADLVIAFQDGGYELGPRIATRSVPESSSIASAIFLTLIMIRSSKLPTQMSR